MTAGYTKETLEAVAANDVVETWRKDQEYGRSWKRRGGVGAFMMLARKWDRLEAQLNTYREYGEGRDKTTAPPYDILAHMRLDRRSEGLIDDIRDLRRYLMLVEAELVAEGTATVPPLPPRFIDTPRAPFDASEIFAGGPDLAAVISDHHSSSSSADGSITRTACDGMEHPFGFVAEDEERQV